MSKRRVMLPPAALFTLLGVAPFAVGCDDAVQLSPQVTARSTYALSGPCPTDFSSGPEFTDEIDALQAVVTGPGIETPIETEGDVGTLTIGDIPAGEDRVLSLYGKLSTAPLWRGFKTGISVTADAETNVSVLMTKIADLTCARNPMFEPRAFHTATVLDDGRVLLTGGAVSESDCGTSRCLDASSFAEIYDPSLGVFTRVTGAMNRNRMFHTATLLDNGKVLVAGGTSSLEIVPVDGLNPFPLKPTQPVAKVELFDPSTGMFTDVGDDAVARVFHAATRLADGRVLLSGGVPGIPADNVNNLSNAEPTTTVCDGASGFCQPFATLNKPRAGHMMFTTSNDDVMVWGGSVDPSDVGGVQGYQMEILRSGQSAFELVNVAGMDLDRNLFLAASAQYNPSRVLAAGGLIRKQDGTYAIASSSTNGLVSPVYVFDETAGATGFGGVSTGPDAGNAWALSSLRFLGSATALAGKRVLITGGFETLDMSPTDRLSLFDEETLSVGPLSVGGTARALREPRGGHVTVDVGDGTVMVSGGETGAGAVRTPNGTGEIFGDPIDPAERL